MQHIMIENKQKLSWNSQQNQKNVNILLNHSSRIQSDQILLKKIEISIFFENSLKAAFLAGWASWQKFTESSCNDQFKWAFSERTTVQNFSQIGQIF